VVLRNEIRKGKVDKSKILKRSPSKRRVLLYIGAKNRKKASFYFGNRNRTRSRREGAKGPYQPSKMKPGEKKKWKPHPGKA